jgi:E3 ubiquitin-protein ligase UBR7
MTRNLSNVSSSDATDAVVTLNEYLEAEQTLEREAYEALPGRFDECTYEQGYIRQPLYSCRSCSRDPTERTAFCYSCSVACHPNCTLIELGARRHFRCDCGNPNFKSIPLESLPLAHMHS